MMGFIIAAAAAFFLLALAALLTLGRMLALLTRLEAAVRALAANGPRPAAPAPEPEAESEQERYARGVANILAYGTRELYKRGGGAQ